MHPPVKVGSHRYISKNILIDNLGCLSVQKNINGEKAGMNVKSLDGVNIVSDGSQFKKATHDSCCQRVCTMDDKLYLHNSQ